MVIAQQPFCWKWISVTKVSKYGKSEYLRALNASYTFQPLMSFWYSSTRKSLPLNFNTLSQKNIPVSGGAYPFRPLQGVHFLSPFQETGNSVSCVTKGRRSFSDWKWWCQILKVSVLLIDKNLPWSVLLLTIEMTSKCGTTSRRLQKKEFGLVQK